MSHADWRAPGAYEDLRSLDAPGFALEYLCRNPDFLKHQEKLDRSAREGVLGKAERDAFARRWGVRFCEYDRDGPPMSCPLGGTCPAKRRRSDGAPR
jgi:hypothetical protein